MRATTIAIGAILALSACSSAAGGGAAASGSGKPIDVGNGTVVPHNVDKLAVMVQAGPTFSDTATKAEGAKAAAAASGVSADVYYSNNDAATELTNYKTIVTSNKYGGIVLQSVSPQLCKLIGQDAIKKQLLVVVMGGPLCGTGTESGAGLRAPGTVAYVDQNNLIGGANIMFDGAAKALGETSSQKVLLVLGNQGHTTVTAHEAAWDAFAKAHPSWSLVGKVYTDWTTPGAYSATQNLLQANPDATVVFSTYIDITAGVVKAIKDQGLGSSIKVYETSGGTDLSVSLLKDGQLAGSVPTFPYDVAYAAVKAYVDASTGTQPEPYIVLPKFAAAGMVTPDTVGSYSSR